MPEKSVPQTTAQKIAARIDTRARFAALVAVLGALVTFSPEPGAALGASVVALVAYELGRRR